MIDVKNAAPKLFVLISNGFNDFLNTPSELFIDIKNLMVEDEKTRNVIIEILLSIDTKEMRRLEQVFYRYRVGLIENKFKVPKLSKNLEEYGPLLYILALTLRSADKNDGIEKDAKKMLMSLGIEKYLLTFVVKKGYLEDVLANYPDLIYSMFALELKGGTGEETDEAYKKMILAGETLVKRDLFSGLNRNIEYDTFKDIPYTNSKPMAFSILIKRIISIYTYEES